MIISSLGLMIIRPKLDIALITGVCLCNDYNMIITSLGLMIIL